MIFTKNKIKKCPLCKKNHELKIKIDEKIAVYNGEKIKYNYEYLICNNLSNNNILILDDYKSKNLINFIDAYRIQKNYLTSQEIKDIRNKYFISEKELSILLNWEQDSIYLYENSISQNKYRNDILLKVKENPIFLYNRLERTKGKIKNTSYINLKNILLKEIKYKNNYFDF